MNVKYQYRISQEDMKHLYEAAKGRMDFNPEVANKRREAIDNQFFFKSEKDALIAAINRSGECCPGCQIWAKIGKGADGVFRIQNQWLVTDDNVIKLSAEYIGMALMYDSARIQNIINDRAKVDDVIAYW